MNIKDLMNDAMMYNEQTLANVIMVLIEKKALKWDDDIEKIHNFLKPQYNTRYKEVMKEMGLIDG